MTGCGPKLPVQLGQVKSASGSNPDFLCREIVGKTCALTLRAAPYFPARRTESAPPLTELKSDFCSRA
jgi:hypothetical protein